MKFFLDFNDKTLIDCTKYIIIKLGGSVDLLPNNKAYHLIFNPTDLQQANKRTPDSKLYNIKFVYDSFFYLRHFDVEQYKVSMDNDHSNLIN